MERTWFNLVSRAKLLRIELVIRVPVSSDFGDRNFYIKVPGVYEEMAGEADCVAEV